MKKIIYLNLVSFLLLSMFSCKTSKNAEKKELVLETSTDTISYIIGTDVAQSLKSNNIEINSDIFTRAFEDNIQGVESIFTPEETQLIMTAYQEELMAKQSQETNKVSSENKIEGQAFLQENMKNEGVKVTESGLQYKVLKEGTGRKPTAGSKVTVHYEGKLLDGTIFDSSYERGETISFGLNQVIPGWTEGLQLMKEGSVYELYIPSDLAYGDRDIPNIPAGSVLIFKVELFSFE